MQFSTSQSQAYTLYGNPAEALKPVYRQNLAPQEGWHKECPTGNWLVFNSYCNELKTSQNVLLHQPHQNSWQSDFGLLNSAYWSYSPPSGSELQLLVVVLEPSQGLPPYSAGWRTGRSPILIPSPQGAEQFPNVNSPHMQSTTVCWREPFTELAKKVCPTVAWFCLLAQWRDHATCRTNFFGQLCRVFWTMLTIKTTSENTVSTIRTELQCEAPSPLTGRLVLTFTY